MEQTHHGGLISEVDFFETKVGEIAKQFETIEFELHRIVIVQIIDTGYSHTFAKQTERVMESDKASCAGDEYTIHSNVFLVAE
jgi:hypothetical protein